MAEMYSTYSESSAPDNNKTHQKTLSQRWQQLDNKKGDVIRRSEDYSRWTLPYVFPITGTRNVELQQGVDSTGARAVNHLSNKLVMTLFQPHTPFFRLMVSNQVVSEFEQLAKDGDPDAKAILERLDLELAKAEKSAMQALDYSNYRTEATMSAKSLIVTGNALMYHPIGGKAQSYNLRDYCVVRDLSGTVVEILTRDRKAFATFHPDVQKALMAGNKNKYSKDGCDVNLYTRIKLENDGLYHMTQAADEIMLDSKGSWPEAELPWIVLTWNLVRGEDYGRGLVEDYAGVFHALHVLTRSFVDCVAIAADIKFFVDPASVLDVRKLNASPSGSYHSGRKDDLSTFELGKVVDLQFVAQQIENFQRQIAQAFLLNSSVTRDAERVTAEEVRYVAQELELSHGGIYSRFAQEWQLRVATLALRGVDVNIGNSKTVFPQIITGLDSLSRAGDLDNLRLFVMDMQLLNEVPEDIRAVIDPRRFAEYIGIRRGVDYTKFTFTADELQANQQAMMQQQQQMMQQQVGAQVAVEAGKSAVQQK